MTAAADPELSGMAITPTTTMTTTTEHTAAPDVNHNLVNHNGHRPNNINNNINKRGRDDNNRFNG